MKLFSLSLIALLPLAAQAGVVTGRTADGCTYKIVNGQYLTECPKRSATPNPAPEGEAPFGGSAYDTVTGVDAAPATRRHRAHSATREDEKDQVTSYGDIPVRANPDAPLPSVREVPASQAPRTTTVDLEVPRAGGTPTVEEVHDFETTRHQRTVERLIEKPYVGVLAGATGISAAEGGAGAGFGVTLGTMLDEFFGVELDYNYTKQGMQLGLAQRNGGTGPSFPGDDANLQSHLLSVELQGHLAGVASSFRPFLGIGLGYKISQLSEIANPLAGTYVTDTSNVNQTSVGGTASGGAKIRVAKKIDLALTFRYFLPFSRQTARVTQDYPVVYGAPGAAPDLPRLTRADDALTGSSQYQLGAGVQYLF